MRKETRFIKIIKSGIPFLFCIILIFAVFSGCSSAPKKPVAIFSDRNTAANQLNLANTAANHGRFEEALLLLGEARRLALTTDDPQLRIRTSISRGNILFALGRHSEALDELKSAAAEGDASNEAALAALARIYVIRSEIRLQEDDGETADVSNYLERLNAEMPLVKSNSLAVAAGYVTIGMAEKLGGHWVEAENTIRRALEIHEKGLFLEDTAYDWFLIASIRSVAGNYDSSIDALWRAIHYDRRAENGYGLASTWQALGDVYQKAGQTEESRSAYRRSADIFKALNFDEQAEKIETRLTEI